MSKDERNARILAQLKATTEKGLKSPRAARSVLIEDGIYTPKGNLRKEFGGRGAPRSATKSAA
jgi:hypothetical protein